MHQENSSISQEQTWADKHAKEGGGGHLSRYLRKVSRNLGTGRGGSVSCTAYVLDLFHPPARRKEENTGSGRQDRRMSGDGAREEEDGSERGRKSGQETSELGRELFGTPFFWCTKQDETKTVAAFTHPRCLRLFMRPYIHTRLIIVCGGLCWAVSINFSLHFRVCLVCRLEPMFQVVRHQHLLTHPSPCPQNLQWQILTRVGDVPESSRFSQPIVFHSSHRDIR